MKRTLLTVSIFALTFPMTAQAAPTPKLYPSAKVKSAGQAQVNADILACQQEADSGADPGKGAVRSAVGGAARGAAKGALAGAIFNGQAGRGAGAGAALGGATSTVGAVKDQRNGSPEYRSYVQACLEEKGYKVVGWK